MKNYKMIIWITLALISVLALVVGCNKSETITGNQDIDTTRSNYPFTDSDQIL